MAAHPTKRAKRASGKIHTLSLGAPYSIRPYGVVLRAHRRGQNLFGFQLGGAERYPFCFRLVSGRYPITKK